jgi:hypothetical protein
MIRKLIDFIFDKLDRRPVVVKQVYRQGFVTAEDLFQMLEIEPRIGVAYKQLRRLCSRRVDVHTFAYVMYELTGVKLKELK